MAYASVSLAAAPLALHRYQNAGWFFPTLMFVLVGLFCYYTTMYLAKAITQVPHNKYVLDPSTVPLGAASRWIAC